jgi:hypothetical protein
MSPSSEPGAAVEAALPSPFSAAAGGVHVRVRLSPRARRQGIAGVVADADGGALLRVAVTAPPVDGRANDALLRLLAREWRVPLSALDIVSGTADRTKIVRVTGDPEPLLARLSAAHGGRR